jgi:hypothetical protein
MTVFNVIIKAAAVIIGVGLASIGPSEAACRLTFVNGHISQICDSTLDLPAIGVAGIPPPVPPSIQPLATPMIPPIGTTSCRQAQVWNGTMYVWQTLCN